IEGDPLSGGQNDSDRHLLVYDKDNNILYETFNTHRPSETGDGKWHADAEAVWDLNANSFRPPGWTSADAAGLPILPGLVRADEVYDQGVITHAIRFTVPKSAKAYVFPASHYAGSNNPDYPRMGERFRLKANVDISGFSAANGVIMQAMKDYGLIVADNGSGWYISGEPSSLWDNDDLHKLGQLHGSDFEALDLTPVVSGVGPTSGGEGTAVLITGLNFSGGAGLTQVYFGATPAADFTINADDSITAVAPPGSGVVDITIVSPYGTSAIVPEDQFDYGGGLGPISTAFLAGLRGELAVQWFGAPSQPSGGFGLTAPGPVPGVGRDGAGHGEGTPVDADKRVYVHGHAADGASLTSADPFESLAPGVGLDVVAVVADHRPG